MIKQPPLRVLVCGGRDYADRARVFAELEKLAPRMVALCHGACGWDKSKRSAWTWDRLRGADRWADEWARRRGVTCERYPADWTRFGRGAGRIRIGEMIDAFAPNLVVAFPGGIGTERTVMLARDYGAQVTRVREIGSGAAE